MGLTDVVIAYRYKVITVAAVALIGVGLASSDLGTAPTAGAASRTSATATPTAVPSKDAEPFADDPPPPLLIDSDLTQVRRSGATQRGLASAALDKWWAARGREADDAAFVAWAATQLPDPPTKVRRDQELAAVRSIQSTRSKDGVQAARWLDRHGSGDLWRSYRKQQLKLQGVDENRPTSAQLETVLTLAGSVASAAVPKTILPAPYVIRRSLRDDQPISPSVNACPCSYPSSAVIQSAAAFSFLSALLPRQRDELAWLESQVDAGQIYRADAFPNDVAASQFLGALVGKYVLVTRGLAS